MSNPGRRITIAYPNIRTMPYHAWLAERNLHRHHPKSRRYRHWFNTLNRCYPNFLLWKDVPSFDLNDCDPYEDVASRIGHAMITGGSVWYDMEEKTLCIVPKIGCEERVMI